MLYVFVAAVQQAVAQVDKRLHSYSFNKRKYYIIIIQLYCGILYRILVYTIILQHIMHYFYFYIPHLYSLSVSGINQVQMTW